jgi:hypothetical protein
MGSGIVREWPSHNDSDPLHVVLMIPPLLACIRAE